MSTWFRPGNGTRYICSTYAQGTCHNSPIWSNLLSGSSIEEEEKVNEAQCVRSMQNQQFRSVAKTGSSSK